MLDQHRAEVRDGRLMRSVARRLSRERWPRDQLGKLAVIRHTVFIARLSSPPRAIFRLCATPASSALKPYAWSRCTLTVKLRIRLVVDSRPSTSCFQVG